VVNSNVLDSVEGTRTPISHPPPHLGYHQSLSIVDSLKRLRASKGARNAFRSLNYNSLDIQRMQFLLLTFDGNVLFEFPAVEMLALHSNAKLM
jgi:hypothetical protein